jgi:hypothetical protein
MELRTMGVVTPLTDGAYVRISGLLFDKVWENTLWFVFPAGAPGDAQRAVLGASVGFWWNAGPLQYLSRDVVTSRVTVEDATTVGNFPVPAAYFPASGNLLFDSLPANVAGVISFLVESPPGGAKGRNYLTGITSINVSGSFLAPAWRANVQSSYADLIDVAAGIGWRWAAVSQYLDGAVRPAAQAYRIDFPRFLWPWTGQRRKRLHNEPHI